MSLPKKKKRSLGLFRLLDFYKYMHKEIYIVPPLGRGTGVKQQKMNNNVDGRIYTKPNNET